MPLGRLSLRVGPPLTPSSQTPATFTAILRRSIKADRKRSDSASYPGMPSRLPYQWLMDQILAWSLIGYMLAGIPSKTVCLLVGLHKRLACPVEFRPFFIRHRLTSLPICNLEKYNITCPLAQASMEAGVGLLVGALLSCSSPVPWSRSRLDGHQAMATGRELSFVVGSRSVAIS